MAQLFNIIGQTVNFSGAFTMRVAVRLFIKEGHFLGPLLNFGLILNRYAKGHTSQ
jgi:hypothetical protein